MSKKKLLYITILLTMSAAGIIGFQVFWMLNAIEVKDAQIRRDIQGILESEVNILNDNEARDVMLNSINDDNINAISIKDLEHINSGEEGSSSQVHIFSISSDTVKSSSYGLQVLDTISSVLSDRVNNLSNKLSEMAQQVIQKQLDVRRSSLERIEVDTIRTRLTNKLRLKGISSYFRLAVFINESESIQPLDDISEPDNFNNSPFQATLFDGDLYPLKDRLIMYFPDLRTDVLLALSSLLVGSVTFMIVILFIFGITVRTLYLQKEVSDIKTDFINNMTHEFKTPVATVGLAIDAIENPKVYQDPEKLFYYTSIIRSENQRMNQQAENVLQMALVDKRDFHLNMELISLHEILTNASEKMALVVEKQNGTINLNLKAIHNEVYADETHIMNVVINLLDNAIKYSNDQPEIMISSHDARDGGIFFSVQDNGMGMSAETRSKVFGKFFRLSSGDIHNIKGFGLGLSYVKAIILAHRGKIEVQSELDVGSTFKVWLPNVNKQ